MDNNISPAIIKTKAEVQDICRKYGLYGNVVYYDPYEDMPGSKNPKPYIIAGTDPEIANSIIPSHIRPDEIIRRNNRASGVTYTDVWAWDMTEGNRMQALEELMDYCNAVEFLKKIYSEFNTPLPQKIRDNEINGLITYYEAYLRGKLEPTSEFETAKKGLEKFFDNENSSSKLRKDWLEFYRSEKYPSSKNILTKLSCFLNRNSNIIDLETLMDKCDEVHTVEMNEYEYKEFEKIIKDLFPEISYAVSDINVIDHGGKGKIDYSTDPPTKYVTQEEFAVRMKERFAVEGWNCLSDLKPCYWEFRKVHFNAIDEPIIAGIYNSVVYQYTNSVDLKSIDYDGKVSMHKISNNDFMNFVCEAAAHDLQYSLDFKGRYGEPSLDFINVITRSSDNQKVEDIINSNLRFKSDYDHKSVLVNPTLSEQIENINRFELNDTQRVKKKDYVNETENDLLY